MAADGADWGQFAIDRSGTTYCSGFKLNKQKQSTAGAGSFSTDIVEAISI
jgi:hypothetical protein